MTGAPASVLGIGSSWLQEVVVTPHEASRAARDVYGLGAAEVAPTHSWKCRSMAPE